MDMVVLPAEPHGLRDYLELLLKSGGNRNIVYDLWSILNSHSEMVDRTWSDQFGTWTPLLFVCYKWLAQDWDDRHTAGKLVEVLLNQGADPNKVGLVYLEEVWIDDVTPLHLAARAKATVIVEMLMVAGANARKVTSSKETVLHSLYMSPAPGRSSELDRKLSEIFVKSGVPVNAQDDQGRTPLHYLVQNYSHVHLESFMMLIKKGASVNLKDKNGRNILELAAEEGHLGLVESLLASQAWNYEQAAEAYELLGQNFRQRSCYEMLMQATLLRQKANCPKVIQEPLACYGGVREWQTERDLSEMRNANDLLERQCQIARERIFKGRFMGLRQMSDYIIRSLTDGDPRVVPLIQRQIRLFHWNGDYTAFRQVFFRNRLDPGVLLQLLLSNDECGMIPEFLKLATECCQKLGKRARKSLRVVDFRNYVHALEKTALIGLRLVHYLKSKTDVSKQLNQLCKACDIDIPEFNYRQTLLLMFLNPVHLKELPNNIWLNLELVTMMIKYVNCNVVDDCLNNCLHLAVASSFGDSKVAPVIKQLIKEGVHYDQRNIHGLTAEDIAGNRYPALFIYLKEHRPFPSLKCLSAQVIKIFFNQYEPNLPRLLANFVTMH